MSAIDTYTKYNLLVNCFKNVARSNRRYGGAGFSLRILAPCITSQVSVQRHAGIRSRFLRQNAAQYFVLCFVQALSINELKGMTFYAANGTALHP